MVFFLQFPQALHATRAVWTLYSIALLMLVSSVSAQNALPLNITQPLSNTAGISRYQECAHYQSNELRLEMLKLTRESIQAESTGVDLEAIVDKEWRLLRMDSTIEQVVKQAITVERQNSNYLGRLRSAWDGNKARELAEKVAERAFGSETFLGKLEQLSQNVAETISLRMESVLRQGASASLLCVQEFIGNSYGVAVQDHFARAVADEFQTAEIHGVNPDIDGIAGVKLGGYSVAGVTAIIGGYVARTLMKRLSQRISSRIAGKIAQRLGGRVATAAVPVVGWLVGIGLIVFDLVDGNQGALPAIEEALTSPEVGKEIKKEITSAVETEMPTISDELAQSVADEIYSKWTAFIRKFNNLLSLAATSPEFKSFLDVSVASDFEILTQVNDIVPPELMINGVRNGNLRRFLDLPYNARQAGSRLLRDNPSLENALAWWHVAERSDIYSKLIDYRVAQYKTPQEMDSSSLKRLLALNPDAAADLALLPMEHMRRLLRFSETNVSRLVANFPAKKLHELSVLLRYFEIKNDQDSINALIELWAQSPELVPRFEAEATQRALMESRNPREFIAFVSGSNGLISLYNDLPQLLDNRIPWQVFFAKYSGGVQIAFWFFSIVSLLFIFTVVFNLVRWLRPKRNKKSRRKNAARS